MSGLFFALIFRKIAAMSANALSVGVVGCGRMGKLHVRVAGQIPQCRLVGVFDANPAAAQATAEQHNCRAFDTLEALRGAVEAVIIATPTTTHEATASLFINAGKACLIEKPLAKDGDECQRIADLARKHQVVVQVGHVERFNPIVVALRKLSFKPGFIETVRISPLPFRSLDVGVVLDVMIHDLDIVLMLADSTPVSIDSVGVRVIGDVEDACSARVRFANGVVANLTASRLAMKGERTLRAFSADASVSIDYAKRTGTITRKDANLAKVRAAVEQVRTRQIADPTKINFAEMIQTETIKIEDVEPLRAEQVAFYHAIATKSRPVVSADDGLAAVRLATDIVAKMTT